MQQTSLGSAGRIDTDDADAYSETIGQWDLELRQVTAGKFHSRTEYVEVAGLLLYCERWSRRAVTTATTPADAFVFGFPRSGQPGIEWCNKTLQHDRLAYSQPGKEIKCITQDSNEHVVAEVPRRLLQQIIPGEELKTQPEFSYHINTDAGKVAQFAQMIDKIISTCLAQAEKLNDARECRAIQVQIMDQLADLLLPHSSGTDDTSGPTRKIVLNQALDYIHHQHAPVALTELAAALDTTPRSLQRAFQDRLHISPLKYLRLSRMNACQKALRKADKSYATVTDIALDWGFEHLGRFACEYRQLFGESPATTLSRHHDQPPKDMYAGIRN